MRYVLPLVFLASIVTTSFAQAETATICSAVVDASTGEAIKQEGSCDTRATAASTFKIAISLMGYDAGFLEDEHKPALPFKEGYVDWREDWKQTIDPANWMAKSVVWYSQQVTQALGEKRYQDYVTAFHYGNEDVSGDPGKQNGLTNAWLSSSLQISVDEQLAFLRQVANRTLPVSAHAFNMTAALLDQGEQPNGWHVFGKTGAGMSLKPDGTPQQGKPFGWFVGWAVKDSRTVVFARLIQDSERQPTPPAMRAKDAVMEELFSVDSRL